ncbi:diacylglycerol kinase family protein [Fibrella sp. HMF5335]|uniref:Diacylglycerol kinase family protein n=1 Tax=Fibrella rubiginis TaxID=2817060 RepID=A0A939K3F0_9BACT|nr:diacylglycerol kinase family protein [Fibrella rubiginis]MBO0935066.1 diacylglycerol kinase family protein [Fibrella rubiginis]
MINLPKVLRSFRFAGQGIIDLFRYENNAKVHLLVAVVVVVAGFWLKLSTTEWALIVTQIGLVWAAEGFNTALEKLCDRVTTQHDPLIKAAKDLAAAAVLILGLTAVVVGLLIFVPRLYAFFDLIN